MLPELLTKNLSQKTFSFKSTLSPSEVITRLNSNTLPKRNLVMVTTRMDFIGMVYEKRFSIISSSLPIGVACVMDGQMKGDSITEIILTTSLHKAFRILILIWAIAMFVLFALTTNNLSWIEILLAVLMLLAMTALFRLYAHWIYLFARKRSLRKLKQLLELS